MIGGVAALLLATSPVAARVMTVAPAEAGLTTYANARAWEIARDPRRSAALYAQLAAAEPGNMLAADRAIGNAIAGVDQTLALRLARGRPVDGLAADARLLLAADAIRGGESARALTYLVKGGGADLSFLQPVVSAWMRTAAWDANAIDALAGLSDRSAVALHLDEQKALMLLALGQAAKAQPLMRFALATAGGREDALRLAFADALAAGGDRAGALAMLPGTDTTEALAKAMIGRATPLGARVTTPAAGFAQVLIALAVDLGRASDRGLPMALAQVAHFAAPERADITILLGLLCGEAERTDDGLALLRQVPATSPLASVAHDSEVRMLVSAERKDEALVRARLHAGTGVALADDEARVGDALSALDRDGEAAGAYARAVNLVEAGGPGPYPWTLHLLRGGALERAGRWGEAEPALERALALAPDNPMVLNYLGYARLERGGDQAAAEALIARASAARPEDPSITDSLGWAQYRRGRLPEAIETLTRAAAADPDQAEIHEHLGDALFSAGRRFEARFAWEAARVAADDPAVLARVAAKIANGLPASATTAR